MKQDKEMELLYDDIDYYLGKIMKTIDAIVADIKEINKCLTEITKEKGE